MEPSPAFYQQQLALLHHSNYGLLAADAAKFIIEDLPRPDNPVAFDLGCGTGILSRLLSEKGFDVTGVDYSSDMLAIARMENPELKFIRSSFLDVDISNCHLVASIGECFNYLFDDRNNLDRIKYLLNVIHNNLRKNGFLIFDILTPEVFDPLHCNRLVEQDDFCMFLENSIEDHIHTRKITLFTKENGVFHKLREIHKQLLMDRDDMHDFLTELGFRVKRMHGYKEIAFRPGHVGFVCQKV